MLSENIRQFGMKSILPGLSNRAISVNCPRKENNLFRWGTLSDHFLCSGTISSWSRPRCIKMLIWQTCQKWKTETTIPMCSTWSWSWRFNWFRMQQHSDGCAASVSPLLLELHWLLVCFSIQCKVMVMTHKTLLTWGITYILWYHPNLFDSHGWYALGLFN